MSTATLSPDRPLRAVWDPSDAESARQALEGEKNRWRVFLNAKDALLGQFRSTGAVAARMIARLQASGAARMVRRVAGWLFGGLQLVRRGLTTAGVRPGIAWVLSTQLGQNLVRRAGKPVLNLLGNAASAVKKALGWCLRLFGNSGRQLADKIDQAAQNLWTRVVEATRFLRAHTNALLKPSSLPMQAMGTLAKARTLSALLRRWLPMPWNLIARVIAHILVLPASVRRDAQRFVGQWTSSEPGPEEAPTPPASAKAKPADVVDLDAERAKHDEQLTLDEPSLQRYPASKSRQQAKRKR